MERITQVITLRLDKKIADDLKEWCDAKDVFPKVKRESWMREVIIKAVYKEVYKLK